MKNVVILSLMAVGFFAVLKLLGWDMSWCEVSAPITIPLLALIIILTSREDETK